MIIDTTYLLPLARIRVPTDLLKALIEEKLNIEVELEELGISLISIFELQAKASKLGVPPKYVSIAIDTVFKVFNIVPYYRDDIVKTAHELREYINDYIDCIILATAITRQEPLITEDELILSIRDEIEERYNTKILSYRDLVG